MVRLDDIKYDPWGTAIAHQFGICFTLYWLGEDIPSEWQFSPGGWSALEPPTDYPDCEYVQLVEAGVVNGDDLRYAGNVLSRYIAWCVRKGMDY